MAALEVAILLPVVMLLFMMILQAIVLFNGYHAAALGAARGVDVAQALDGTPGAGATRAQSVANQLGAFSGGVGASGSQPGDQVRIEVTGNVPSLFPGAPTLVSAVEFGPKERQPDPP